MTDSTDGHVRCPECSQHLVWDKDTNNFACRQCHRMFYLERLT